MGGWILSFHQSEIVFFQLCVLVNTWADSQHTSPNQYIRCNAAYIPVALMVPFSDSFLNTGQGLHPGRAPRGGLDSCLFG